MKALSGDMGAGISEAPTVREIAVILFRQKRVFLAVFGGVLALAVIYALAGSGYEARMKIMVRRGRADPPVTAQDKAPLEFEKQEVSEEEVNSEVELLQDNEVLRRVVAMNGLTGAGWEPMLHPWATPEEREERAVRKLVSKLHVAPVKKTHLIEVTYSTPNPQRGARVLQSLGESYLEKHREVHRPSGELKFFEQQTEQSRQQLDVAENQLREFTLTRGVVEAEKQRDLMLTQWNDADASHRQTEIEIAEASRRKAILEQQLAVLPARTTTVIRSSDNPELQKALKSDLLDLEVKHTALLTKYEPGHPLLTEVESQIAQAKSAIAEAEARPLHDESTEPDPNHEWAKSEAQKVEVELRGLHAKDAAMHTELAQYRREAEQLGQDAVAQNDLESSARAAQENYLLYVKKREEARMADAADERGIVNAVIAERPEVPALPKWPALTILLGGCFGAAFAGTAAAFAADAADPGFRTPEEVLLYLDTPVLAALPSGNAVATYVAPRRRPNQSVRERRGDGA